MTRYEELKDKYPLVWFFVAEALGEDTTEEEIVELIEKAIKETEK